MNAITRFLRDEEGATAIEYGVIAGLITILLVALFANNGAFSQALNTLFNNLRVQIGKAVPAA